jgi:peptide/nickel transport system permease protein
VLRFISRRLAQAILTLLLVSLAVFMLARMSGSPVELFIGDHATAEDIAAMTSALGLDRPLPIQYLHFIGDMLQGNFGKSVFSQQPTLAMVMERMPATLQLALAGMAIGLAIALPLGVVAAYRRGSVADTLARSLAVLGQATPIFWSGLMLILVFGVWFRLLPAGGSGDLRHLVLPAVTLGFYNAAGIMRITRSSMLEVLDTEYVKALRAKGVSEFSVIWRHALKNAALPIVTFAATLLLAMVSGTIVTETVFAWPGVGRLVMQAVLERDFPMVQTVVMLLAALYIVGNLLVDILYAYLNPKIRFGD